jgi:hypothetical protein
MIDSPALHMGDLFGVHFYCRAAILRQFVSSINDAPVIDDLIGRF